VSNADERELAEGTASAVDGITSVANDIKVDPAIQAQRTAESPLDCRTSDNALADRVKTQLYWHRATHGMRLEVTAQNGVITLDGKDTDPRQARLARLIALNTCGVRQVKSRIMTESRPWPA
jgi:osmotically-inducible protein OsmY